MSVNIEGLDKAMVLAALYNGAKAQGAGFIHYDPKPMSREEAQTILSSGQTYFDYLQGRVMKIDLSEDIVDPWLYDRDNGEGAVAEIIEALKKTKDVNPEEVELRHKDGTRNAAILMDEHLHDRNLNLGERNGVAAFYLGTDELAEHIEQGIRKVLDEDGD